MKVIIKTKKNVCIEGKQLAMLAKLLTGISKNEKYMDRLWNKVTIIVK